MSSCVPLGFPRPPPWQARARRSVYHLLAGTLDIHHELEAELAGARSLTGLAAAAIRKNGTREKANPDESPGTQSHGSSLASAVDPLSRPPARKIAELPKWSRLD